MNTPIPPVHLSIQKGSVIEIDGREYRVTRLVDIDKVLAKEKGSDLPVILSLSALDKPKSPLAENRPEFDLEDASPEDWEEAERRLRALEPLLAPRGRREDKDYQAAAEVAGVGKSTIYRWLEAYKSSGLLTSLLPQKWMQGAPGKSRLRPEVKAILDNYLQTQFLTLQKPSSAAAASEVRRLCSNAGLSPLPSASTIARHISWLNREDRIKKREGSKAAFEKTAPKVGKIPDVDWPLQTIQVDHTELPIMIVDDEHRLPIKRPWVTLGIDVNSRCCVGMYLSLDAPSSMSAGMCISHAILPKDQWLNRLGLSNHKWPQHGLMDSLHMDNAKEFRGEMLRHACKEYNINLKLRPVAVPHFGAHIERLMGTVSEGLKVVKGATFSGPKEKGEYDAEGQAVMTFAELEKWLALFFIRYHVDMHRGIGTTPETKWKEGLLGTSKRPGRGLPVIPQSTEKIRIDFMPFERRTVQDYGVQLDDVKYYSEVLRPWVNSKDPELPKYKRQFMFHRDPRDISVLHFFDPELKRFFQIPYRDSGLQPVSIWELREGQRRAKEMGMKNYSERTVFNLINEQRSIEEDSAESTKKARRALQKRKLHEKARAQRKAETPTQTAPPHAAPSPLPLRQDKAKDDFYDDDY